MAETITQAAPYLVGALIGINLIGLGWRYPAFGLFLVLLVGSYASVHVGAWVGIAPGVVMLSAGGGWWRWSLDWRFTAGGKALSRLSPQSVSCRSNLRHRHRAFRGGEGW
ncbi:hypothetical protein HYN69_11145 [Gemmobacter aquarius]|uniref:Uncharacterized protein n=1 Tax=Paragemmobacter aquarius TaxID=2169400 RepID=A0A2S0UMG8_9RHOB|nr:hypothetical protein [Gemmobacter aquarius]AWB48981.1 hypothetical protein HYN69_11145 [Gemmobacter aquarius]